MIHPLYKYSFETIKMELNKLVADKFVNQQRYPDSKYDLTLYNYTHDCVKAKTWNDFTCSARGFVLSYSEQRIIAPTFPKFFNYGEGIDGYTLPPGKFEIFEKLDGSFISLFYFKDKWFTATRGSFTSVQAQWAEKWLCEHCNLSFFDSQYDYLFEVIYHENRIVVKYDFEGCVLLSMYHVHTGHELSSVDVDNIALRLDLRRPKRYTYATIEELVKATQELSLSHEGFVTLFEDGSRKKWKGDPYCRMHALISQVTPLGVWRAMMANDNIPALRDQLPEEYQCDFDTLVKLIFDRWYNAIVQIQETIELFRLLSDKELGILLQDNVKLSRFKNIYWIGVKFVFVARKNAQFFEEAAVASSLRTKVFNCFRPDGNVIDGYMPSTILNRFRDEK